MAPSGRARTGLRSSSTISRWVSPARPPARSAPPAPPGRREGGCESLPASAQIASEPTIAAASPPASGQTRTATSPSSSTAVPPAPQATTGPKTGSVAIPTRSSTPCSTICWTRKLVLSSPRSARPSSIFAAARSTSSPPASPVATAPELGLVEDLRPVRLERDPASDPFRGAAGAGRVGGVDRMPASRSRSSRGCARIPRGRAIRLPAASASARIAAASSGRRSEKEGGERLGSLAPADVADRLAERPRRVLGIAVGREPRRPGRGDDVAGRDEHGLDRDLPRQFRRRLARRRRRRPRLAQQRLDVDRDQRVDAVPTRERGDRPAVLLGAGGRDHVDRVGGRRLGRQERQASSAWSSSAAAGPRARPHRRRRRT